MIRQRLKWVYVLAIVVLVPLVQGCLGPYRVSGGPLSGQILENQDRQPLAEAIVLARWKGDESHSTVCFHVASTTTDTEGRYLIPAWKKKHKFGSSNNQRVYITPYKAGYRWAGTKINDETRILLPDARPSEQRLQYLLKTLPGCGSEDESEKNLIPIRKAIYEEVNSLASTKEDEKK